MMRPLDPAERMTDRFDLASTLNFTIVAEVRGPLSEPQLVHALRCLERRHPLLRAAVVRSELEIGLLAGAAAAIPLQVRDASSAQVLELAAASIDHAAWVDDGPRAHLTWLRHGPHHGTLLLRLHHVVSDGSSGMLAMRDLLSFLTQRELASVQPLASPGQEAFFPSSHAQTRARFVEAARANIRPPPVEPALRLSRFAPGEFAARRVRVRRLTLTVDESSRLLARARRDRATVHGVLAAALAYAVCDEQGAAGLQRIAHAIDLRRYLAEREPEGTPVGDAVGYYVSGIGTEHRVDVARPLGEQAAAITAAVRAAKAAGEPLISAPLRGADLVERTRGMPLDAFRELAEQRIFSDTFGITNLGPLERLGLRTQVGELEVLDLFFVAAQSVMSQLGASAVSFAGRISLQLTAVEPLIAVAVLDRLAERSRALLVGYAAREE